jgi:hypothetical protein
MEVPRKDPNLQEALDLLDARFVEAEGDPDVAYSLLTSFELNFIDEEIYKCLDFRYYAENYHIINSKHKGFVTLYPFWDSQEIFYAKIIQIQLEGRPVKIIVLKARQLWPLNHKRGTTFPSHYFYRRLQFSGGGAGPRAGGLLV